VEVILDAALVRRLVCEALEEDHAAEDATTAALIPADQQGRGLILAKAPGVIAGLEFAETAFREMDGAVIWQGHISDGDPVAPGLIVATVSGSLGSLVRAERTALNFLTHLSGIATTAAVIVRLLDGTGCRLRDTRKTIPGLRLPEKYAARMGGAETFRTHLADGLMAKDNHIAALRARELDVADAVRLARRASPALPLEIEVTSLGEARAALEAGADELLLDNMEPAEIRDVVEFVRSRRAAVALEASGGISAGNAREFAETGVDYVSIGAITHSAPALDLSLEIEAL
jgi:nicotinate-nucleotide pyrophosphorylase (carboxylating)